MLAIEEAICKIPNKNIEDIERPVLVENGNCENNIEKVSSDVFSLIIDKSEVEITKEEGTLFHSVEVFIRVFLR